MREDYPADGDVGRPVCGHETDAYPGATDVESDGSGREVRASSAAGRRGAGRDRRSDGRDESDPRSHGRWWVDLVVFLVVVATTAALITVGHLSPPNLAAYAAVVTSLFAAWWRPPRRRLLGDAAPNAA